jgi:hypothetical protein
MTQSHLTTANDPARQAAYRRLALTILALDVRTLAARLQASRPTPSIVPVRRQAVRAA